MKKGILYSFLTAAISGISVFANAVYVSGTDPLIFAVIRNTAVVVLLSGVLWGRGQLGKLKSLTRKEWGFLVAIGAIGGGVPFALFFSGLSLIGPVNGNILHKTLFLWVAILAIPILKERLTKLQLAGYGAVFWSLFVFGGTFRFVPAAGSYLVLAATLMWATENILAKITLKTVHPEIVAWGRMFFGLPFLLGAASIMGKTGMLLSPSSYAMTPIVVSSLLLVAYVTLWYKALSRAPATLVSSVLVIAPAITAVLGSVFLARAVSREQTMSFIILTAGVLLIAARYRRLAHD